jgi:hypothetical protein
MDRLFVECGGNSLSAVRLAEDISFALNVDAAVTSELVDTVLHGRFQDVVDYLCRVLCARRSDDDIVRGDDLWADPSVSLLQRDGMMSANEASDSIGAVKSSETEPEVAAVDKSIRRLSSTDVSQLSKRRRHASSNLNADESTAHVGDVECSTDTNLAANAGERSDVTEDASDRSLCNCLDDSLITKDSEFFSVARGSCRIICCHVTDAEAMRFLKENNSRCHISRLQTAYKLESQTCCRGWSQMII